MYALLILLAPLVALIIWGVAYDLKRRHRAAPLTNHDPEAALRDIHRKGQELDYRTGSGIANMPDVPGF